MERVFANIVYLTGPHSKAERGNEGLIGSSFATERGKSTFFVIALFPGGLSTADLHRPSGERAREKEKGGGLRATLVSGNNYSPETTNPRIQEQRFRHGRSCGDVVLMNLFCRFSISALPPFHPTACSNCFLPLRLFTNREKLYRRFSSILM